MEDEFSADYESDRHDYVVNPVPQAHMPFIGALFFGAWYSIVLASAMSLGVKYLHPETPAAHGILQSIAWALGSGIAIALASRMSKNHRWIVGIFSTVISAGVWIGFLYFLRYDLDQPTGDSIFGHELSVKSYLFGLTFLIVVVGLVSSFLGAESRNDEEITGPLFLVPTRHWLWLWIGASVWVSMVPVVLYYVWLQFATALFNNSPSPLVSIRLRALLRILRGSGAVQRHRNVSSVCIGLKLLRWFGVETGVDISCGHSLSRFSRLSVSS
jgi:hypothetical protein